MNNSNIDYATYLKARHNCLQMGADRGWQLVNEIAEPSEEQFEQQENIDLPFTDSQGHPKYIKFTLLPMTNKAALNATLSRVAKYYQLPGPTAMKNALDAGEYHLIVVSPNISTIYNNTYIVHPTIELYLYSFFMINPTKHVYQPQFQLITDPVEIKRIYQQLKVNASTIPTMCLDDPITRWYGARPASKDHLGHVFKIIRRGQQIYYRQVSAARMNK